MSAQLLNQKLLRVLIKEAEILQVKPFRPSDLEHRAQTED